MTFYPVTVMLIACCLVSCNGGILNPPSGPGTDYPCGLQDRSCGNGKCCGRSEECGTGLGCPKDSCCPLEDDFYAGKPRQSRPQFAPFPGSDHTFPEGEQKP